jgi:benzoyl-CoA reductase/2-hydroxyglutaryl-CoA dehydratase subunit BcrC/BadD/HgdB
MNREPARISVMDWHSTMGTVPQEFREECRSLRNLIPGGVEYLFSQYEYSCRGDLLLRRLKFDSSLEALRLWAFLFSEKDRLFLAKEKGWKIVAAMKDLGQVPVLTYGFPETLTFYADELWWAPCFSEETHLLDEAAKLGAGEELCFVRAALGAMVTLDYFPSPDLCIAGVGACCDDFSAIMQLIEGLGYPVHWWEMASHEDSRDSASARGWNPWNSPKRRKKAVDFVRGQLSGVVRAMENVTGKKCCEHNLRGSLANFNRIRGQVRELRELVYMARRPPLPGLEMFLAEFIAIHACSEPRESVRVLDGLLDLVRRRLELNRSPLVDEEPVRVFWVTPPTDASLITLLEDMGGCIAGTEYLISHAFMSLRESVHPVEAVAENCLDDCMTGSQLFRAERIARGAARAGAEGVIISGISGASHCPWDERAIRRAIESELGIPVLSFDVPFSPGRHSQQVVSRMEGFMELLRDRRKSSVPTGASLAGRSEMPDMSDPFQWFRNSMSEEVDLIRAKKRQGIGVAGIYCEFTPREVILAAGALPVCLCGASRRTIPAAETVLPSNLCPLIKSSFGYILTSRCPFFVVSDIVIAETTCDGKKKMYELIADRKPQHILELTQKVEEEEAFNHWMTEVDKLKTALEVKFGREITDGDLERAIAVMNTERCMLRKAMELGRRKPSIVSGLELAHLRYRISGLPEHLGMLEKFVQAVEARREPVFPAGTPRVMLTGCPMSSGTFKVIEILEKCGGVVVVQETCSGWKPLDTLTEEDTGNPLEAIARKHFAIPCSCMTPNSGRMELIGRLAREFRVDAVVDLVWHACLTYSVESWQVEKYVREDLGLSYLKVDTDYSESDRERLSVRIQTMLEMI